MEIGDRFKNKYINKKIGFYKLVRILIFFKYVIKDVVVVYLKLSPSSTIKICIMLPTVVRRMRYGLVFYNFISRREGIHF